ncbi:MAG: prephenate dehydrogenase/arogenate dehydrogenase family protein [Thermodesulfovibrionales bacterium]|nr:prephenate dehydrogenase/arogenate dehydrogenase family protein [Thermodesulfovibrionales bacterium]
MANIFFNKISIIGIGLLGASFAMAARKKALCNNIHGFSRDLKKLQKAKSQGIIDEYSHDIQEVCKNADLVVLATPVGAFLNIVEKIKNYLKKDCLITDLGSIKGNLVYSIESLLPQEVNYIGSHPIAGGEKSGLDNAKSDLFENALCILTPTEKSNNDALNKLQISWRILGSKVELMNPHQHDEVYALVSHLPHLVAYALVITVGEINEDYISFAGQGFKDTTRIAMSSPEIWRDISFYNKDNLIRLIRVLKDNLDNIENYLNTEDFIALEKLFIRSKKIREKIK